MNRIVAFFLPIFFGLPLGAQIFEPDSIGPKIQLETVTVSATRLSEPLVSSPWAVSVLEESTLDLSTQKLNLNDYLDGVPGVFTTNAYNFAQDLRVSIRGFGARSAFGIRGVKILVDGLPESTPDGQGQVDNLDLGMLEQLEVLRGAASSMYGNASGGVINIQTDSLPTVGFLEAGIIGGSFGFQRYHLKGGQEFEDFQYLLNASYTGMEGFREQSAFRNTVVSGKARWWIDDTATLMAIVNYGNSPQAQDPGGLTLEDSRFDPKQAWLANRQYDAGEEVEQYKVGLLFEKQFDYGNNIHLRVFHLGRDFQNRLPFAFGGAVDLQRNVLGGGASWNYAAEWGSIRYSSQIGIDLERQVDDRSRFQNLDGRTGDRVFEQEEMFSNLSGYLIQQFQFGRWLGLRLGGRLDAITMEAKDRFLNDGDNSDQETYQQFSPSVGLNGRFSNQHFWYANWSTSFETPVLSERFANPSLIPNIGAPPEPQTAKNYEVGFRGHFQRRVIYELALFYIELEKELVPFEVPGFPGRTFYRNTGQSSRQGIELGFNVLWSKNFSSRLSYTYSDFMYDTYQLGAADFKGNFLPGIPRQQAFAALRYHKDGWYAALQARYIGQVFADDANDTTLDEYLVMNLRAGYRWNLFILHAEPFVGINNLTDTTYPSNIRINAFGGRFIEPAPGINFYIGLRLRFGEGG